MAGQPIVHVDFASSDPGAAATFFAEIFGWQVQHDQNFDYHMFRAGGGPGGGFVKADEQNRAEGALVYVGVDDIEATLAQVEARGGKTIQPKMEIPGTGWFGIFTEPGGARVALYTEMHKS